MTEEERAEYEELLDLQAEIDADLLDGYVEEDPNQYLTFVANPDACPYCTEMDGARYTAEEWDDEDYWKPHPNCNCELEAD